GALPNALVTSQQPNGVEEAELISPDPGQVPAKSIAWLLNQRFTLRLDPETDPGLPITFGRFVNMPEPLQKPYELSVMPNGVPALIVYTALMRQPPSTSDAIPLLSHFCPGPKGS